jgi:hypothetical protein
MTNTFWDFVKCGFCYNRLFREHIDSIFRISQDDMTPQMFYRGIIEDGVNIFSETSVLNRTTKYGDNTSIILTALKTFQKTTFFDHKRAAFKSCSKYLNLSTYKVTLSF